MAKLNMPTASQNFNLKTHLIDNLESMNAEINNFDTTLNDITDKIISNNIAQGICATIAGSITTSMIDDWKNKLTDINCVTQLCVMETIDTPTSYTFTPINNRDSMINYYINNIGKSTAMMKPHIGTVAEGDGFSRSGYMPNNVMQFFANWKTVLLSYAAICNTNNIPILCLSCEQFLLTVNTYLASWKDIINSIKAQFPNLKLTMAYTYKEITRDIAAKQQGQETLIDNLDIIGINSYTSVDRVDDLRYYFNDFDKVYHDCKMLWDKDILITEIGCTRYTDTSNTKYIYPIYIGSTVDYTDQRTFINTVLSYVCNNKNIDGVYIWHINSPFAELDDVKCKNIIKGYFGGV